MNPVRIKYRIYIQIRLFLVGSIGVLITTQCEQKRTTLSSDEILAPISIEGLRTRHFVASLKLEKKLKSGDGFDADLLSFYSDSLKVYALHTKPKTKKPEKGYPLIIFGHGFHPEPKKYGVSTLTGEVWRPGDYYRGIPETYARNGFMVITPDYRGHNVSDGFEFTQMGSLAHNFYTIDLLHLIAALKSLNNVNLDQIFYLGHSMGGDVGLRLLLTTNKIKAASFWSPVSASTVEQALHYGKYYDIEAEMVDSKKLEKYTNALNKNLSNLNYKYNVEDGDPVNFIQELNVPVILHHATGDPSVPYMWSESLAARLFTHQKPFEFYTYKSNNHLFKDENKRLAYKRDINFFNKYIKQEQSSM